MPDQPQAWSRIAESYEEEFIDPHRRDVRNPLVRALKALARRGAQTVADLGCGIGPLLPFLAEQFPQVYAVDFAEGMLQRARAGLSASTNVSFLQTNLTDLSALAGRLDAAIAVNSLVQPELADLEQILEQTRLSLKPRGYFLGIVPAMDAVHYYTMLLLDCARAASLPPEAARKNAAFHAEHSLYDFAFGEFRYKGLEQHFWQPFEIRYRFERAGFRLCRLRKVLLSWKQFACGRDLQAHAPPWDWFFVARVQNNV